MMEGKVEKCEVKTGGYAKQLCEPMQKYAQRKWNKGGIQAIIRHDIVDIETSESLGTQITLHRSGGRVIANFCPFCGGKLRDL